MKIIYSKTFFELIQKETYYDLTIRCVDKFIARRIRKIDYEMDETLLTIELHKMANLINIKLSQPDCRDMIRILK